MPGGASKIDYGKLGQSWLINKHAILQALDQTCECHKRLKTAAWFESRHVKFAQLPILHLSECLVLLAEVAELTLADVSVLEIPFDLEIYTCLPSACVC